MDWAQGAGLDNAEGVARRAGGGQPLRGRGTAFGAISVVNAIAGGRGITVGIRLKTEASVELERTQGGWSVGINGRPVRSGMAVEVVRRALALKGMRLGDYSGRVETATEIPLGAGLKSSSSASVAIALATLAAVGERDYEDSAVLGVSVEASLASGVSVTGALDDAASCLAGGVNFADNIGRKVLRSERLGEPVKVALLVPRMRSRRKEVRVDFLRRFSKFADLAFRVGEEGDLWGALVLNGIIYSSALGYDARPAMDALAMGALGAGLSGTGPAVSAAFRREDKRAIELLTERWARDGSEVIVTESSDERGRIEPLD